MSASCSTRCSGPQRARSQHEGGFIRILEAEGGCRRSGSETCWRTSCRTRFRVRSCSRGRRTRRCSVTSPRGSCARRSRGWARRIQRLRDALLAGITAGELAAWGSASRSIVLQRLSPEELVLDPLPNHLFTRDSSAWIGSSVSISPMRRAARRREAIHLDMIYRRHPLFAGAFGAADGTAAEPGGGTAADHRGEIDRGGRASRAGTS